VSDHEAESPLRTWVLRRQHAEAEDAASIAAPALEAMFALADGLLQPLALDAEIGWFYPREGEFRGYASPMEWHLEPGGSVDPAAAHEFIARASDQQGPTGAIGCPFVIAFATVRARVFESVADGADRLVLLRDVGPGSLPLERDERGVWVTAPADGFITAPVEIRARLDREMLEVEVAAHWSPWSEEDRPATQAVEAAVARVAATGWELGE
jgi:hypothetical protein